jgi:hypothetical protein
MKSCLFGQSQTDDDGLKTDGYEQMRMSRSPIGRLIIFLTNLLYFFLQERVLFFLLLLVVSKCHAEWMGFDRMSTDKAITCRAVRKNPCVCRSPITMACATCDLLSPTDTFPLAEKEPDGGHHFPSK